MRIGFAKIDSKERLQLYGDTKGKFRMQYVTKIKIHPYLVEEKYGGLIYLEIYMTLLMKLIYMYVKVFG